MKKLTMIAMVLVIVMAFAACSTPAATASSAPASSAAATTEATTAASAAESASAAEPAAAAENPNEADFTYIEDKGTTFDINNYYNSLGVDCNVTIRSTGGAVSVKDTGTTTMPKANEKYKIGFSVYYTVDEVGAMILEEMKTAASEAGVELLVNDANYDQNAQNQAIEQWILEGVDGVIVAPCDFTAVSGALDALETAKIPVVALNAPLQGNVDAIVMGDCVDQGKIAADMLIDAIKASGKEVAGTIVYQTLPFVHPNAATRTKGFKDAFAEYPGVEFVELTGTSPEEHYTAFEGALQAYPDMIGAWGLYSSATIGMNNAKKAADSQVLLTSIDNDKAILAGVKEGSILGTACYSAITPSFWAMDEMVNLLNGVDIPSVVFYENKGVTAANVDDAFATYYPGQSLEDYMAGKVE